MLDEPVRKLWEWGVDSKAVSVRVVDGFGRVSAEGAVEYIVALFAKQQRGWWVQSGMKQRDTTKCLTGRCDRETGRC